MQSSVRTLSSFIWRKWQEVSSVALSISILPESPNRVNLLVQEKWSGYFISLFLNDKPWWKLIWWVSHFVQPLVTSLLQIYVYLTYLEFNFLSWNIGIFTNSVQKVRQTWIHFFGSWCLSHLLIKRKEKEMFLFISDCLKIKLMLGSILQMNHNLWGYN